MSAPRITSVAKAVTPYAYPQAELTAGLVDLWKRHRTVNAQRIEALHAAVQVQQRHLAVPKERYAGLERFEDRNRAWVEVALELGERAIRDAMAQAQLPLASVDAIFFTTVTGLATPSIDARLVNRLGLKPAVKRTPMFGLGCVAGVAGVARAADYLRAFPGHTAALLSVELCSLTVQRDDVSVANIIAAGLFGDGAAAAVLRGADSPGAAPAPRVVASESVFYPGTEDVMGWDFLDSGFRVVLSAQVPQMVLTHVRGNVDRFLAAHGLTRADVTHWVAHTGGPKVLEAFEQALELPANALARSWRSLERYGNLSSSSVLFVMADLLEAGAAKPGDVGLMVAMGPGFCSELVLLQW